MRIDQVPEGSRFRIVGNPTIYIQEDTIYSKDKSPGSPYEGRVSIRSIKESSRWFLYPADTEVEIINDIQGEARVETSAGIDKVITVESYSEEAAIKWADEKLAEIKNPEMDKLLFQDTMHTGACYIHVAADGTQERIVPGTERWEELVNRKKGPNEIYNFMNGGIGKIDYNQRAQETPWVNKPLPIYLSLQEIHDDLDKGVLPLNVMIRIAKTIESGVELSVKFDNNEKNTTKGQENSPG